MSTLPAPTPAQAEAISSIVSNMLEEEHKHWQESGCPTRHIYHDILALQEYEEALLAHENATRKVCCNTNPTFAENGVPCNNTATHGDYCKPCSDNIPF